MSNIEARLHFPLNPGTDRENALEKMLNLLAESNAVWFSEHPDAPCCPACAGVRYYDPPVGRCQNFWSAPDVLRRGRASCADAAAYEAGVKLAEGHHAVVRIEPIDGISLHAVCYIDGERVDPSSELAGAPHRVMARCELAEQQGMSVGSPYLIPPACPAGQGTPALLPPRCPTGGCPSTAGSAYGYPPMSVGHPVSALAFAGMLSNVAVPGLTDGGPDHFRGRRFAVGSCGTGKCPSFAVGSRGRRFAPARAADFYRGRRVSRAAQIAVAQARRALFGGY